MKQPLDHCLIRASAGTGKTYQLALRYLRLLAAGVPPEEILATTFTRKAAGEILDRVLLWLAKAVHDPQERQSLAQTLAWPDLDAACCRQMLRSLLDRLHALRIGTLDSFFLQIALAFSPELGLVPGWSICDELDDAALRDEAIQRLLADQRPGDLATLVHALTKGATRRSVARLVQDTIADLYDLYCETTPQAWRRWSPPPAVPEERLQAALDRLQAFADDRSRLGSAIQDDLARWFSQDPEAILSKGLFKKIAEGETTFHRQEIPPEIVSAYRTLLNEVRRLALVELAWQTEATCELLERFETHYKALQAARGTLRFTDVTACVARVQQQLDGPQFAFRLDGPIRHLLLDEFQDTSPLQWRALRPLARRIVGEARGTFFCVGDGKQAIYGWRGGVAEILDALPQELAPLRETTLDLSYRASPPVIDAVNTVFQNLTAHPNLDDLAEPLARWQAAFPPHRTAKTDLAGLVQLLTGPATSEGEPALAAVFEYTAQRVEQWRRRAPWARIAVLVRTNAAVAHAIYCLRKREIPASEEGGNTLVDAPAVELILSLLMLADHPGDRVARFHLAHSPLGGPLAELLPAQRGEAGAAAVPFHEDDDLAAALASRALRRQLLEQGYGPTVLAWARCLAPWCDARQRFRLEQLVEQAYAYQGQSTLRPSDFVRLIEQTRVADPLAAPVRVMTIHQAKGLEFDIVLLPELTMSLTGQPSLVAVGRPAPAEPVDRVCRLVNETVRQILPEAWQALFARDRAQAATEALCLLYVAMTRAVHVLEMILPPARDNERTLPKTFAGLLRATLAPDQPAQPLRTLYTHGDLDWERKVPPHIAAAKMSAVEAACPTSAVPKVSLAPATAGGERGLKRVSPSTLEGGHVLRGAALLASRQAAARDGGTLLHLWLAQIGWLEDGLPEDTKLAELAAHHGGALGDLGGQMHVWIDRFRRMLARPAVAALLSRAFYQTPAWLDLPDAPATWPPGRSVELDVSREWSFAVRRDAELVSGAIDRLVVVRQGQQVLAADVIDFKTDELPSGAGAEAVLAGRCDYYRPQVEAYRDVVARMLRVPVERVGARLVFLQAGRVVPLTRSDPAKRG